MTAYNQIFLRTVRTEESLIRDLSTATGTQITAIEPAINSIAYGAKLADTVVEVEMHHEFEQDRDLNFDAYPVLVTFRNLHNDKSAEERFARTVFEELTNAGGYELLLVFNLQTLIART